MASRIPILQQGSILIASIQEELSDSDILEFQRKILERVVASRASGVILDVSSLDVIDSFGARTLGDIAKAIELRGARMVIVGIQPEVALSMVLLGLSLRDVTTSLDLDSGLAVLGRSVA